MSNLFFFFPGSPFLYKKNSNNLSSSFSIPSSRQSFAYHLLPLRSRRRVDLLLLLLLRLQTSVKKERERKMGISFLSLSLYDHAIFLSIFFSPTALSIDLFRHFTSFSFVLLLSFFYRRPLSGIARRRSIQPDYPMDSQTVPTRIFLFLNFDTSGVHHSMARTLVIDTLHYTQKSFHKKRKMGISGIHPVNGTMRG